MVFFTCNHCGESVKKPSVEKHYNTRCRGAPKSVSCMDCQKDFHNEEYVVHTKCITELEKYSGKDYVAKEQKNSGAKKQESWMDTVRSILESSDYKLSSQVRSALQRLQSVDNVPRKKAKFQNFVSNCMRMQKSLSEEVWNVLEKEQDKMKQAKQAEIAAAKTAQQVSKENDGQQKNGVKREAKDENEDQVPAKKKSKKEKNKENAEVQAEEATNEISTIKAEKDEFQWTLVLEKIIGKHSDGIALEKLKKKLLKKYQSKLELDALTEKQQKKFEKKFNKNLKKCSTVQVEGDLVKAC